MKINWISARMKSSTSFPKDTQHPNCPTPLSLANERIFCSFRILFEECPSFARGFIHFRTITAGWIELSFPFRGNVYIFLAFSSALAYLCSMTGSWINTLPREFLKFPTFPKTEHMFWRLLPWSKSTPHLPAWIWRRSIFRSHPYP